MQRLHLSDSAHLQQSWDLQRSPDLMQLLFSNREGGAIARDSCSKSLVHTCPMCDAGLRGTKKVLRDRTRRESRPRTADASATNKGTGQSQALTYWQSTEVKVSC